MTNLYDDKCTYIQRLALVFVLLRLIFTASASECVLLFKSITWFIVALENNSFSSFLSFP